MSRLPQGRQVPRQRRVGPFLRGLGWTLPLLLLAQVLPSCGSDEEGKACNPGDSRACPCTGENPSTQTCNDEGSGYNQCGCGTASANGGSGGGGGSSSTGGTSSSSNAGSASMQPSSLFPSGVGEPCTSDSDCQGAPLICILQSSNDSFKTTANPEGGGPQGGYCSVPCSANTDCTTVDEISACNQALGLCFAVCLPGQSNIKCLDRAQVCFPIVQDGSLGACVPRCTSDAACGPGRFCDPTLFGLCVDTLPVGGAFGSPCSRASEDTDCASGLCIEYGNPNTPGVIAGSFCSTNCTAGRAAGCGFDAASGGVRQAACFSPQLTGGNFGDLGFCSPLCDTAADCLQAGWVCNLFDDPAAEAQVGRLGECLPPTIATGGAADAGPG
ncbi:MAG: hypothetical protein RL033_1346 [Pseudomonadota bacterium]|jgi:hypothetical protein